MIKKSSLFVLVIAILFMLSWGVSGAAQQDEQNLEKKIAQLKEKIQELRNALERDPKSEKAEQWRGYLREHEQRLRTLERGREIDRPRREEGRLTDWEVAIKRTEGQIHEIESYLVQLRKNKENEEEIHEVELRLVKTRNQLAELKAGEERRKRGAAKERPSAYQRERGELTAYVISATSEDVTVRLKDSGKVMVLRVRSWHRVEGRRVPNTDMIKMVKNLKKNQMIWARFNEGEERGVCIIQEIKRIKDDK